ncbi:futalosine hydrolase, partial [Paenibacillus graminis]|nr:futalosine hydrolase [Paenibacillus graminis]
MDALNRQAAAADDTASGGAESSRVLIVTAVAAERDAVLRGLNGSSRFDVIAAG